MEIYKTLHREIYRAKSKQRDNLGIKRLNIIKNGNSLGLICIQLMEFIPNLGGFLEKN